MVAVATAERGVLSQLVGVTSLQARLPAAGLRLPVAGLYLLAGGRGLRMVLRSGAEAGTGGLRAQGVPGGGPLSSLGDPELPPGLQMTAGGLRGEEPNVHQADTHSLLQAPRGRVL